MRSIAWHRDRRFFVSDKSYPYVVRRVLAYVLHPSITFGISLVHLYGFRRNVIEDGMWGRMELQLYAPQSRPRWAFSILELWIISQSAGRRASVAAAEAADAVSRFKDRQDREQQTD